MQGLVVRRAGSGSASGEGGRAQSADPVALAALELLEDSTGPLDGTPWLEVAMGSGGVSGGRARDDAAAQRSAGPLPPRRL